MREEEERLLRDHPTTSPLDYDKIARSLVSRTAARREATNAVLAVSAGKGREEIRELLITELRSRNVEMPPEPVLEADVDFIAQGGGVLATVAKLLRSATGIRTARRGMMSMFENARPFRGPTGKDPYFVPPDRSLPMVDVILDPATAPLRKLSGESFPVSLQREEPTGHSTGQLIVYVDAQRIGVLSEQDSEVYKPAVDGALREDRTLMVMSVVDHPEGATFRMKIYPAGVL